MNKSPLSVLFLCGCRITVTSAFLWSIDSEGFVTCPEHGQRRYGWRSKVMIQYELFPFDKRDPQYTQRPAYDLSDIENERLFWSRLGININEYSTPESVSREGGAAVETPSEPV